MTVVETGGNRVAFAINQNVLRHVVPGQSVEVIFKLYPGRSFAAKVESIACITPEGQLPVGSVVPTAPLQQRRLPFGVIPALDDDFDVSQLPGGSSGTASI